MASSVYTSAILIRGPRIVGEQILSFLQSKMIATYTIGDGVSPIMDSYGHGKLKEGLQEIKQLSIFTNKNASTLIIIDSHGTVDQNDDHSIEVGQNGLKYYTASLFLSIREIFKKQVDIIFTSCHGRAAFQNTHVLPLGSKIAMFSNDNEATFIINYVSLFEKRFPAEITFSIDTLFEHYLFHLMSKEKPVLLEVGNLLSDPYTVSHQYLGKPLDTNAKKFMTNKYTAFCNKNKECLATFERVINNIEHINSIDELFIKQDTYLLTKYKLLNVQYLYLNSTYNHFKLLKQNPAKLTALKEVFDEILVQNKIPCSVNLEELGSVQNDTNVQLIEYVYYNDPFQKYADQVCDYTIYNDFFGFPMFQVNNNFRLPERPDYGPVLLAIKYLNDYDSLNKSCMRYEPTEWVF